PVAKPAAPVAAAQPAAQTKTAKAASANDYVFVEPSYKPKDDTQAGDSKTASVEPPARVVEAASKFADKPASELIQKTDHAAMQSQSSGSSNFQPAVNLAAEQKTQMSSQPSTSGPKYTGEPISVNLKDVDLKDFFRLIHEISGLNVVLDPNVHGTLT